jgi:site-specific recombinase XerD
MTTLQPLDIRRALTSFDLALRAENKSPGTVELYSLAVRQLTDYLEREGHSLQVADITRDDVNGYQAELHGIRKPSTVDTRYRSLQVFFKFLVREGDITENPMRNMHPPRMPEILVPVLSEDDIKSLLKTCVGNSFEERRDLALIRLFANASSPSMLGLHRRSIATCGCGRCTTMPTCPGCGLSVRADSPLPVSSR